MHFYNFQINDYALTPSDQVGRVVSRRVPFTNQKAVVLKFVDGLERAFPLKSLMPCPPERIPVHFKRLSPSRTAMLSDIKRRLGASRLSVLFNSNQELDNWLSVAASAPARVFGMLSDMVAKAWDDSMSVSPESRSLPSRESVSLLANFLLESSQLRKLVTSNDELVKWVGLLPGESRELPTPILEVIESDYRNFLAVQSQHRSSQYQEIYREHWLEFQASLKSIVPPVVYSHRLMAKKCRALRETAAQYYQVAYQCRWNLLLAMAKTQVETGLREIAALAERQEEELGSQIREMERRIKTLNESRNQLRKLFAVCAVCDEPVGVTVNCTRCSHFVCRDCYSEITSCPFCRQRYEGHSRSSLVTWIDEELEP
jgi:hypothetical protein